MFETFPWLSCISFTIKHNKFEPHFYIFHIYELSMSGVEVSNQVQLADVILEHSLNTEVVVQCKRAQEHI